MIVMGLTNHAKWNHGKKQVMQNAIMEKIESGVEHL
jgi:hypothetical protein